MKLINTLFLLISFGATATVAFDKPNSYIIRDNDFDPERGLWSFGLRTCDVSLKSCQASQVAEGNSTLPTLGGWLDRIPPTNMWLDNETDPIWMDIIDLMMNLEEVDFNDFPQYVTDVITNLSNDLTAQGVSILQGLVLEFTQTLVAPTVANVLDSLISVVESTYTSVLAPVFDQFMPIVVSIVSIIQNIQTAMPQGTNAVMAVISTELIGLTADITTLILQMVMAQNDEAASAALQSCAPALMECRMTSTVTEVMPTIVGSAIMMRESS